MQKDAIYYSLVND